MSVLRRAAATLAESRGASGYLPWGDSTPPPPGMFGGTSSAVRVSEQTSLQVDAVYGSVGVIADASTLPVIEYRGDGGFDDQRVPLRSSSTLVTEPYSEIDLVDFQVQFAVSLALRGNFFGRIISRDKDRFATQIKPIHPDQARVRRIRGGPDDGKLEYRFEGDICPAPDVVHVRNISVAGAIAGLNPIECLRDTIGFARAADMWGGAFMANSAQPLGAIQVPGELDPDETLALAHQFLQTHQGIGQSHLPVVLTGGQTWTQISVNPEDAQFLESKQYTAGVISGMIFRVPPHMIGVRDQDRSLVGIEQLELSFVRNTLIKYLIRYERMISKLLPAGRYCRVDVSERLRGDTLQRYQAAALAIGGGWLNKDEVRADERRPPIPDGKGQIFYEPVNMTPLGMMGFGGDTTGAGPGGLPLVPNPTAPSATQKPPSGQ